MTTMTLTKTARFEAAHWLPRVPPGHACGRVHGHSYTVRVCVTGEVDEAMGWVMDLGEVGLRLGALVAQLDHQLLNELDGLHNPTSEALAAWLWRRLLPDLPGLSEVEVFETATTSCRYAGG